MWTLAIFFLAGGQAQLFEAADIASCQTLYRNSGVDPAAVERAMCTSSMPRTPVYWIVKPKAP